MCMGLPLNHLFLPHPTDETYNSHTYPTASTCSSPHFPEGDHLMVYTDASGGPNNQWAHLRIVGHASVIVHPTLYHCMWVLLGGTDGPQTEPAGELQAVV